VFQLPQLALEAMVCDEPCNVSAAYIPHDGIYMAENLDPLQRSLDRSILLHELVHHLQQGHPKFGHLTGCARELAKEQEAYAIQNAYLATLRVTGRAVFYKGQTGAGRASLGRDKAAFDIPRLPETTSATVLDA